MEDKKAKKKIIEFHGSVELSTGSNPGSYASFSIPVDDPTKAMVETGETGDVQFASRHAELYSQNVGPTANILRDMRQKLESARKILERIKTLRDREDLNSELNIFIPTARGVIGLLVSRENKRSFRNLGFNDPQKEILNEWEKSLAKDDLEIVKLMQDQRNLTEHERIVRPGQRMTLELTEVVHINLPSVDKRVIEIGKQPKISSQGFYLEGREVVSLCSRYLELLKKFLLFVESKAQGKLFPSDTN